jgi:hypothetical protein
MGSNYFLFHLLEFIPNQKNLENVENGINLKLTFIVNPS